MSKTKKTYIFILCPHFQGSTVLVNLLTSSNKTSTFFKKGNNVGEGTVHFKEAEIKDFNKWTNAHDLNYKLDYSKVKEAYDKNWDLSKPVLVEKCPLLISRAKDIEDYFSQFGDVYFLISIRSPYSTDGYYGDTWIKNAKCQKKNIESLKNKILTNYEEACLYTDNLIKKIQKKIPILDDLKITEYKDIKGERGKKIHSEKVHRVLDKYIKNRHLKNNKDLMKYFNYDFIN